jgi:Peptidase family M50
MPYAPTRIEVATYVNAIFMIAAGLLIVAFADRGAEVLGAFFTFWGAVIVCNGLTAIVHELGHALAARSVGMTVSGVTIGSGPALTKIEWRSVKIEFRKFLLTGGATFTYFRERDPEKWRYALMVLGGIIANVVFIALIIICIAVFVVSKVVAPLAMAAAYAMITSQALVVLANLWPRDLRIGRVRFASDGKLLLKTLRSSSFTRDAQLGRVISMGRELLSQKRYAEARRHFAEACAGFPDRPYLLSLLIHSTAKANGSEAALQCYFDSKGMIDSVTDPNHIGMAWVCANAAWYAVLTERKELLPIADELMKKAVAIMPDEPAVQATEGAVRIRMGDVDAGSELLIKAVRSIESMDDKSDAATLLADVERLHGDAALANEMARWVRYVETTI